ncbi:unnamed protein product [Schistosoma rodhaini]|uniref:Uncharacterized protein n=1 Tax=Schistosoma rodhaini TaxID=6188 RepID=A0AA85GB78_9TREM|nr:unnamed protein product [Schistosoma rodhaini]CAH8613313.1 unnamed protein product [Schistosoma rodhaini]CAH8623017.1 unnamed protein product [Schistosoma rodhaini]
MKSILKNRCANIQRSNSLDTKHQTNESVDEEDDNDRIEAEKSKKKRAFIRDENGVCRPGELDEDTNMSKNHESRSSVVDRTAAERISCRLVQQRSLDFGLYRKLNNFNIDSNSSSTQSGSGISENDDNFNEIRKLKKDDNEYHEYYDDNDNNDGGDIQLEQSLYNIDMENEERGEEEGEQEDSITVQNDEFYTNPKIKELGKEFTLKDILGHRVPELEIDNIKDDEDMGHNE